MTSTSYSDYHTQGVTTDKIKAQSLANYQKAISQQDERLVSCSDDFTLFLWKPFTSNKPVARMTGWILLKLFNLYKGHQGPINHVAFSPNTAFIASASFDKSVKLWNGFTGKYFDFLFIMNII